MASSVRLCGVGARCRHWWEGRIACGLLARARGTLWPLRDRACFCRRLFRSSIPLDTFLSIGHVSRSAGKTVYPFEIGRVTIEVQSIQRDEEVRVELGGRFDERSRNGYHWLGFRRESNLVRVWVRLMYRDTGATNLPPSPGSSGSGDEDALLLSRVGRGEEQAMAALYDRYSKVVYSVSLRVLRDPASAEDVLQEIFMQIWRNPEGFTPSRGSLGGWLAVVSRNRSIDALRRRKPTDSVEDVVLASPFDLGAESERNLMIERARGAIVLLPQEQRKTLEMAFFDGLTHSEIAEMTGDPLGTVKTRIRSALTTLRKAFQA